MINAHYPYNLKRTYSYPLGKMPRWIGPNLDLGFSDNPEALPSTPALSGSVPTLTNGVVPSGWKVNLGSQTTDNSFLEVITSSFCEELHKVGVIGDDEFGSNIAPQKDFVWVINGDFTQSSTIEIKYSDNTWVAIQKVETEYELLKSVIPCYLATNDCTIISGIEFRPTTSTASSSFQFLTDPCYSEDSLVYIKHPQSNTSFIKVDVIADRFLGIKSSSTVKVFTQYLEIYTTLDTLLCKVDSVAYTATKQRIFGNFDYWLFLHGLEELSWLYNRKKEINYIPRIQHGQDSKYMDVIANELGMSPNTPLTTTKESPATSTTTYFTQQKETSIYSVGYEGSYVDADGAVYSRFDSILNQLVSAQGDTDFVKVGNKFTTGLIEGAKLLNVSISKQILEGSSKFYIMNNAEPLDNVLIVEISDVNKVEPKELNLVKKVLWGGDYSKSSYRFQPV